MTKLNDNERPSTNMPLVSVVVVAHNRTDLTIRSLRSLEKQTYANIEIILVDNGSESGLSETVSRAFPSIKLLRLDLNLGFAGGVNRGIAVASGKFVALINNDAVADKRWLEAMVEVMRSHDNIGSVAPVIVDGNEPDILDSMGMGMALDGMSRQAFKGSTAPSLKEPQPTLCTSGCACLLRKEALDEVGLLDERFFAYCEDTDLGLRLRWAGWKCVIAPNAHVTHYQLPATEYLFARKVYLVERNHYWVAVKNFPLPLLALLPVMSLLRHLIQIIIILSRSGELYGSFSRVGAPAIIYAIVKATFDAAVGAPAMALERYKIRKKISSVSMIRILLEGRLSFNEILNGTQRA